MSPPAGGARHLPPCPVPGHSPGPLGPLGGRVALANRPHRHPEGAGKAATRREMGTCVPGAEPGGAPPPSYLLALGSRGASRSPRARIPRQTLQESSEGAAQPLGAAGCPWPRSFLLARGPDSPGGLAPLGALPHPQVPGGPVGDRGGLGGTAPRLSPSQGDIFTPSEAPGARGPLTLSPRSPFSPCKGKSERVRVGPGSPRASHHPK